MFVTNKLIRTIIKCDYRHISLVKKSRKPIITPDQQLFFEQDEKPLKKSTTVSKKSNNFYDIYFNKSIEQLFPNDERLGVVIVNARSLMDESNDLLVIEGVNMIRDAIKLNGKMTHIYFTDRKLLQEIPFHSSFDETKIFYVNYRTIKKFSNLSTPPGIMAVFKRPESRNFLVDPILSKKLPLTLILDNIRDPGNLGTIIRTAAGFNVHKILMIRGCVNLYNEKVLRSSMSSIFCTPVFQDLSWIDVKDALRPDCVVFHADISHSDENEESFPYYHETLIDFRNDRTYGLVVGGEIDGVSDQARQLSVETFGCKLTIPIVNHVNSLNSGVAAAIIMSEFQRKFLLNK